MMDDFALDAAGGRAGTPRIVGEADQDYQLRLEWTPNPPGCIGAMGAPVPQGSNAFRPCEVCKGCGFIAKGEFPYSFDRCADPQCGGSGQVYLK